MTTPEAYFASLQALKKAAYAAYRLRPSRSVDATAADYADAVTLNRIMTLSDVLVDSAAPVATP